MIKILILGGTQEARLLVKKTANLPNIEVRLSLAGRTNQAVASKNLRVGGFGGVAGLVKYLKEEKIDLIIDATHPFAAKISDNAATAADNLKLPRLMLIRAEWKSVIDDKWIEVENIETAAEILPDFASRVFLTIGKQELTAFSQLEIWFLMRAIEKPSSDIVLPKGLLLLERGPFDKDSEKQLLKKHNIDTIVSKNSGGDATYAKIIAARELGIKVVMVKRPMLPQGEWVEDVESALEWIKRVRSWELRVKS